MVVTVAEIKTVVTVVTTAATVRSRWEIIDLVGWRYY